MKSDTLLAASGGLAIAIGTIELRDILIPNELGLIGAVVTLAFGYVLLDMAS